MRTTHARNKRRLAIGCLAAGALLLGGSITTVLPVHAATTVNMEKVVLAAQLDPAKAGTGITPGAKASVTAVEKALADEGHLERKYVDGHFGRTTVDAYAAYQKSKGATGEGANGLPGKGTLTALGKANGFTVVKVINLGGRTTVDGHTVNQRTANMLKEAEKLAGVGIELTQGSYNKGGVEASAGTHDGGGAVDVATAKLSAAERKKIVTAMRKVGFAAWDRTGVMSQPHIHAMAISDTDMASAAWKADRNRQIFDYYNCMDGLVGHSPDNGPKVEKTTWEDYQRAQ
ncbi:peptidoglycan-binding protein [Arthrobacter tecti]